MKFAVLTFGCRVNQADSACIDGDLRACGGSPAPPEEADLIVVNSCSVTSSADGSARQAIRRIARRNPDARIVVTGCYATRAPDELVALPGVRAVVTNDRKEAFVADIQPLIDPLRHQTGDGPCGVPVEPAAAGRTVHTLAVQTGCDDRCSYCVIPRTRGRGRSRSIAEVLRRVKVASDAGFKEVVLSGVHLGSFGRDRRPASSLVDLLRALDRQDAACRLRLSSLEPMDCTEPLIDLVARSGRFVPHFHLPLQHASDACLRAMGRPYSLSDYRRVVDTVRDRLPDAALGSDAMAGFPGETERDHDTHVAYLADSPLTSIHVFPYADRPGTASSRMPDKVDGGLAHRRARELRAVAGQLQRRFQAAAIGTIRPALVLDDRGTALTDNYLKVQLREPAIRNCLVDVRVESAELGRVTGRVVSQMARDRAGSRAAGRATAGSPPRRAARTQP